MRYTPKITWASECWTHNIFRFYELCVGRKYGIRLESSAGAYIDEDGQKIEFMELYSFESKVAFCEMIVRRYLSNIKRNLSKIRLPEIYIDNIFSPSFSIVGFGAIASTKTHDLGYRFLIATDATGSGSGPDDTTLSWTHVCTGSNLFLFVGAGAPDADVETGATYNSAAISFLHKGQVSGDRWGYDYYTTSPATGSHSVTITNSGVNGVLGASSSYSGVAGLDGSSTGNGAASATASITTTANNCWMVGWAFDSAAISVGANTTSRVNLTSRRLIDTNGVQTPAGSHSMAVTSANNPWILMASMAPVSVSYSTTMSAGSFALTGISIGSRVARYTVMAVGSFVLTLIDFTSTVTRILFHKEALPANSFTKEVLPANSFSKEALSQNSFTKEPLG